MAVVAQWTAERQAIDCWNLPARDEYGLGYGHLLGVTILPNGEYDTMAIVLDLTLRCPCGTRLGYCDPPGTPIPDNIVSPRERFVHLAPVYRNREGESFYRAGQIPRRGHDALHLPPDEHAAEVARVLLANNDFTADATWVPFLRFRVKCAACGIISEVTRPE